MVGHRVNWESTGHLDKNAAFYRRGFGENHVTSTLETMERIEIFDTHYNRQVQGNTANGAGLESPSFRNHGHEQPSQQSIQHNKQLALLGTMAAVFAHEVGNPLYAVSTSLEFMEIELVREQTAQSNIIPTIQLARREIDRLASMLRQFRSLASSQDLDLQLADLGKVIEEVLALQNPGYRAAGITAKFECEHSLPRVILDAGKITQAILNLCKNAVEAMPDGGCLSIRLYTSGPMIVMEVADSGVDVPGGVDVFQLFKTTKPAGSGLGLPVVQQIVSAHNGTIDYVTELGHGTTFTVNLPANNRQSISL
jgi:two-component system, LuxR family, sensor kinase FixL